MPLRWLGHMLLAATAIGSACTRPAHASLASPMVLPFELRHDLIIVTVSVNGHPAPLILDTGAGAMLLDSAFATESQIDRSGRQAQMNGHPVPLGTARSVALGSAPLTDVMVVVASIEAVQSRVGRDVRGVIGADVFEQYVVTVDYPARTITLSEPSSFNYRGAGTILPLHIESRLPAVDASIVTRHHGTLPARLHFDLGSSGYALRFTTRFTAAHDLAHDTTTITGPFAVEVTGASDGDLLRLPAVRLGDLVIARPSVALSRESTGPYGDHATTDGTIGEHVFGRMRVIVDYSRAHVILEPLARLDVPDSVAGGW